MEIQQQPSEPVSSFSEPDILLEAKETENLVKLLPGTEAESQWQRISQQVSQFLGQLPDYLAKLFQENKSAIISLGVILLALIVVKGIIALLGAIHSIPLLSLLFEIVGLVYAFWFTLRYLLKFQTRQELIQKFNYLRQNTVG